MFKYTVDQALNGLCEAITSGDKKDVKTAANAILLAVKNPNEKAVRKAVLERIGKETEVKRAYPMIASAFRAIFHHSAKVNDIISTATTQAQAVNGLAEWLISFAPLGVNDKPVYYGREDGPAKGLFLPLLERTAKEMIDYNRKQEDKAAAEAAKQAAKEASGEKMEVSEISEKTPFREKCGAVLATLENLALSDEQDATVASEMAFLLFALTAPQVEEAALPKELLPVREWARANLAAYEAMLAQPTAQAA